MNYHSNFKHEQEQYLTSISINYGEQLTMLIETLQFVVEKMSELCRWQQEQSKAKRRKSLIKVFDKNIDAMPNIKIDSLQVPVFDQFSKIVNKLQLYKTAIPNHPKEQSKEQQKFKQKTMNELITLNEQMESHQIRIKSLQTDMLQLISLYKDLL